MIDVLIAFGVIAVAALVAKRFTPADKFKWVLVVAGALALVVVLAKLGVL